MSKIASRAGMMAGAAALALLSLAGAADAKPAYKPPPAVFADFAPIDAKSDITWANNIIPAVYKTIPAVTQTIPAVTQTIPAVYKTIPAVTKIVNGKVVVVTPAKTVLVSPAKTIVITPAKTIIITPAQKVLVTPAHDGPSGSMFSTTSTNSKVYGLAQTDFRFMATVMTKLGVLPAQFSFQATSPAIDPVILAGAILDQTHLTGDFSFTYDGNKPLKVYKTVYLPGANLLSGHLAGFMFDGSGGSGAIFGDNALGEIVDLKSDFLDFSHTQEREFSWYFLSSSKFKADPGAALHTISGSSGGSFASAPRPWSTAVPEPAAWALMIGGFGLAGAALRRRRARAAAG